MSVPFAGYARVSRVGNRADTLISPELQQERIERYAQAQGLAIDMLPPELDVSGGKVERPILEQAIQGIEQGRYAGIAVATLDRLSRMGIADALHVIARIEQAGGRVVAVAEDFHPTPEGELGRNVMLSMSNMLLQRYRLQFAAAKEQAVRRGIWPIPKAPYGYRRRPDRRLEPDRNARIVKGMFLRRSQGHSWADIARWADMPASTVQRILQNRAYLGEINLGDMRNPAAHEPIVSRDLWEAAQLPQPRKARGKYPTALLSGLVRCAGCQRSMGADMTPSSRIYRCRGARQAGGKCQAPAIIGQAGLDRLTIEIVQRHARHLAAEASARSAETGQIERKLHEAEGEAAHFQEAVSASGIGIDAAAHGLKTRADRIGQLRAELARARLTAPVVPDLRDLDLTVDEWRHVLRGAIGVVWVRKGRGLERVKVIARGLEPEGLSRPGRNAGPVVPLEWTDLPGELRMPGR